MLQAVTQTKLESTCTCCIIMLQLEGPCQLSQGGHQQPFHIMKVVGQVFLTSLFRGSMLLQTSQCTGSAATWLASSVAPECAEVSKASRAHVVSLQMAAPSPAANTRIGQAYQQASKLRFSRASHGLRCGNAAFVPDVQGACMTLLGSSLAVSSLVPACPRMLPGSPLMVPS